MIVPAGPARAGELIPLIVLVALGGRKAGVVGGPPPKISVMLTGTRFADSVVVGPVWVAVRVLPAPVWPKLMIGTAFAEVAASRPKVETLAKSIFMVDSPWSSAPGCAQPRRAILE